jgi:hypothetical protein
MHDAFKGFLVMRLVGLVALVLVVAVVLGILALTRGSEVVGAGLLGGVGILAAALSRWCRGRAAGINHRA